ncbi:hypothetical protein BDP55DRAFT_733511 [Colletotrichum godetiae]|uniref:DUF7136 domain-containing protein n=1 Tax=Colletotrichum godetiae TaxID=1209918 RepID=A0AAJ0A9S2_9PEZI|nr:uncharacterized protein BDP55DRAFT_733511 [Colletotrichum godetiae]KAK1659165.1 hypothetical protein BDP55DRAFT_733511 [Colletotrichum godetiae]
MLSQRLLWLCATLLASCSQLTSAELPADAIELDLVFPRGDGKYAETTNGYPVLLNVQNPDVAYKYGYNFVWDIYSRNKNSYMRTAAHGIMGASIGNESTFGNGPHLEVGKTGHLAAGDYTFAWVFGMGAQCEFTEQPDYSEFNLNPRIANGSFDFTVETSGKEPSFTTCPSAIGSMSYASTTTYNSEATSVCAVTASVTHDTQPCSATVSNDQATSVYSELGYARATGSSGAASLNSNLPSSHFALIGGVVAAVAILV